MNTLSQRTKKYLEHVLGHPENYRYLLGVSGGPDSMAMGSAEAPTAWPWAKYFRSWVSI